MGSISWVDLCIWVVYFTFIFLLLWVYRTSKKESYYRFFLTGFLLKVAGGIGFALIYVYYYQFGDTFLYHRGATVLSQTFLTDPGDFFRLLLADNGSLPADLTEFSKSISYSRGAEEWFMVKLLSPISLMSFHSYFVATLFMSFISFIGAWKLFQVLHDLLPARKELAFIGAFLIPSVLFWGGGIMKDTFTLAGINIIIYCVYFTFFKNQFSLVKYGIIAVSTFLVFFLKGYVIIAFIPGLLFGINRLIRGGMQNVVIRRTIGLSFLLVTIGIIYLGPQLLAETSAKYTASSLEGRVKGFHSWHSELGGATYNLGEINYTLPGVVEKVPVALNVTFFRPYLWESSSIVVLIAGVESALLLFMFIYLVFRLGGKMILFLVEKPMLITFALYCLVFGFIVGFTSYNFGALGRYKIPIFSLFTFLLIYLYTRYNVLENTDDIEIN